MTSYAPDLASNSRPVSGSHIRAWADIQRPWRDITPCGEAAAKIKNTVLCHRPLFLLTACALFCALGCWRPVSAQSVVGTGSLNPDVSNVQSPNWSVGGDLVVGDTAPGTLTIDAGAAVTNVNDAYVGNFDQGIVVVQRKDGNGTASTWSISGQTSIGVASGSNGTLNVLDGGAVTSIGNVGIGLDNGSIGTALVSGPGSVWVNSSGAAFLIGLDGSGTLQIANGGAVHSGQGTIGLDAGSDGHVFVSDPGSIWDPVGNIYVGAGGTGELHVQNGATVSTAGPNASSPNAAIYIGYASGSAGTVTVSSSSASTSTLKATDYIAVGWDGAGTLNIQKGGLVSAGSDVHIAASSTAEGTLNLTGDATGRGILETGSVIKGGGTGALVLNLDGGILRANRDETNFLNGFATLPVNAGGAWFDTNSHEVGVNTAFSGTSSINKLGAGTLTLTGNSSAFTGSTEIQAGTLQVDGILGGPANVWAGGRLTGIGQVGPATNRGTIAPGPRSGFGTLTVAGDYVGQGGNLEIRTQLGDDTSPTDRLVIMGSTSGATPVTVINVGGAGAQTQQGIQVVRVSGVSAGQFNLANGDYVIAGQPALVAGAYGYVLQRDQGDGNWYLRSSLKAVNSPDPGGGGTPPNGGTAPPDGGTTPPDGGSGTGPLLYQPGVPVYEAYANTLMSLSQLPTLRQRVGNRQYDAADTGHNGVWGRVEGTTTHLKPSISSTQEHQNIDSWKAQFGVDRILSGEQGGSRLVGGFTVHYGTADTHVSSDYGNGSIDTTAYGLGPTLTWYGKDGTYVDAQAQATWFNSDLASGLAGRLKDGNNAHSYGLSIEAGKSFPVNEGFAIIPQAQLSYVSTDFNRFDDKFGAQVDSDKGDSLQGRIGLALDYTRDLDDGGGKPRRASVYGVVNVKHEFLDGTRVQVSGVPVDSRMGRTWGGIGLGGNYSWGGRYALYGEVGTEADFSGSYTVTATAGFRMAF